MYEFKLADLGEGMHEAEIVQWLIKEGDTTKIDQTIARVETDKAVVELPAPVAGRVSEIRIKDGQTAKVGEVLVVFETPSTTSGSSNTVQNTPSSAVPATATDQSSPGTKTTTRARPLAVPAVRKLAFELGVDLEQVTPSSPSGRISIEDVRAYAAQATSAPPEQAQNGATATTTIAVPEQEQAVLQATPILTQAAEQPVLSVQVQDERQPLTGLRKRIAEHMERSWRTIPHATAFDEVDGSGLLALRQALKPVAEKREVRLTYMPLLVKLLIP
ncbi:MAG: biotin/lipoyl-containing protein, partial [Ktedonobacteraceae bacterium]